MNEAALEEAANISLHRSEAKSLLKEDIENNTHKELKLSELWATKAKYQAFSLETFHKHICQEVETKAKCAYQFSKKNKKKPISLRKTQKKVARTMMVVQIIEKNHG